MRLAAEIATWSKDGTRVGCVLVDPTTRATVSTGYNGLPRGVDDSVQRYVERPGKYALVEHAERNAIYNAARLGHKTEGTTAYINWDPHFVCCDCARAFIQAGIRRVVGSNAAFPGQDRTIDYAASLSMFKEAGVEIVVVI